jgi:pyruvate/2-oxoglutarate dehydrogenase complex dihydrolipoamide acyltransferase (E2) component
MDVLFPSLSKDRPTAEGVVSTWFVIEGQTVTEGELLAEVQVDKVAVEVPAPVAGIVHLLVAENDAVNQGSPIATVG